MMVPERLQRTLLIAGFVLFVAGSLYLMWFFFFRPLTSPSTNANTNAAANANAVLPNVNAAVNGNGNTNGGAAGGTTLPTPSTVANGGRTLVKQLSDDPALSPVVAKGGDRLRFYNSETDQFMEYDPATGAMTALAAAKFPDVDRVAWAPNGTRAAIAFPDGSKIVYDFSASRQYSFPKQATEFSFSPDSAAVAYQYLGGAGQNFLVTANFDGSNAVAVQDLGDKASSVQVAWSPSNEVIALLRKGLDAGREEIVPLGQRQENFPSIQTSGRGFDGLWTPDGAKLLYTVYSEATNWNPELYLVGARGEGFGIGTTDLGLQTFVDKCAFDGSARFAYCGVPDALERGSGLYPEFSQTVNDRLYRIDMVTGTTTLLADPVSGSLQRYTVGSISLSADGSTLFFTDASTGRLLQITLHE